MPRPFVDHFLQEVTEVASRATDFKVIQDGVVDHLRRLLSGSFVLDALYLEPTPEGFARREIYRDPGGKFVVTVAAWAPQQSTAVHDHPRWGVVASLSRRLLATTYRRVDEGTTQAYASLTEMTRTLVTETSFSLLRPPDEAVHRIENPYKEPALTIHVMGLDDAAPLHVYDLDAKAVMPADASLGLRGI